MRPILRPGTHVLRRGTGEVQVGLDPGSAIVLPDTAPVRASLRLLAASADLDAYDDRATVRLLAQHDLLIDEGDLHPLLGAGPAPQTVAALVRCAGPAAPDVHAARRGSRTRTAVFGGTAGAALRAQFLALTGSAGIREASPRRMAPPDCGVLLGVGEPDRSLLDGWTRAGTPYLLVRLTEGRAVIGPFVAPGRTACLRCLDAHCADADPEWPLLVQQYVTASSRARPDGAPEPVDPLLAALALAWAARDVATYVDGGRPSTWSATVTLDPRLTRLETRPWLRHPACSCTWE